MNQAEEVNTFKLDLNDRDPHKQNQGLKVGVVRGIITNYSTLTS